MNAWRIQRAAAFSTGLVLLLSPVIGLGPLLRNAALTSAWWTPVCAVVMILAGLGLVASAATRFRGYLVTASVVGAAVQLLVIALWFPAWTGAIVPADEINPIWVSGMAVTITLCLTTTVGYLVAVGYLTVLLTVLAEAYSLAHAGHYLVAEGLRATISGAMIGVFLAVVRAAMHTARRVDADRDRVLAAAAAGAARSARAVERERLDAVVRDEVITVLRTVRAGPPAGVQREQAVTALAALRGSRREVRPSSIAATAAHLRLRETVIGFGDHIGVAFELDPAAADYPADAIDAVVEAAAEAIGNSLRHAGPAASQAVLGQFSEAGIRLRIVDDGAGFATDRVAADRMGLEKGIRERMAGVGGAADVVSAPDEGTMVSLEWRRS